MKLKNAKSSYIKSLNSNRNQPNRYHKTLFGPLTAIPDFSFRSRFLKGWLYCFDIMSSARHYYSVIRAESGVSYVTPLIDSVGFGDRVRLYRNATRFYYFVKTGSVSSLAFLRTGFLISNIGFDAPRYVRSNGTYAILKNFSAGGVSVTLPSGITKRFSRSSHAFFGRNAAPQASRQYFGKASTYRYGTRRTIVRSCAKNPVDHPNGGRTRGKQLIKTPWGRVARSGK